MARLKANSERDAAAAAIEVEKVRKTALVAASAVEEVKTTLKESKADTDDKLEGLAEIGVTANATVEKIHLLVNSQLGEQLRLSAETSRFKADTLAHDSSRTKIEREIAETAAQLAESIYIEHQRKQKTVDDAAEKYKA